MTPEEEITQMVLELAQLCGRDLLTGTIRRYVQAVSGVTPDRLRRAIESWIQISHFFPQPDELLEMNARLGLTPEEEVRAREKLLARIDWNPKQLESATEGETVRPDKAKPTPEQITEDQQDALTETRIEEALQERARQLKQEFLIKNAMNPTAPLPGLPELRLPKSNIEDLLQGFGGETEGLVM